MQKPESHDGKPDTMAFDLTARIEGWRTKLLDTSKRNRLISFKAGRSGGIHLVHPDPDKLWRRLVADDKPCTFTWKRDLIDMPDEPDGEDSEETDSEETETPSTGKTGSASPRNILDACLRSPRLRDDHLLTDMTDRALAARLSRLALTSRESVAELGVVTLHVAFGFLRWYESPHSQIEILSPLLLIPVRLERDSVTSPWKLRSEGEDVLSNHSLAQLLAADFRLRLPSPEDEGPESGGEECDQDDPRWRERHFDRIRILIREQPRWEVRGETALGTFNFQKLAMWDDLDRNRERLQAHPLVRAIAGDPAAEVRHPSDLPAEKELDRKTAPIDTFHILDADSSQHEAIEAAKRGASFVLDGPPGTGKSQTIANIIAEFLAAGRTVLFVSEKSAALEVVQRRLEARGLADFCLACHSHKANKKEMLAELGRCLSLPPESTHDLRSELIDLAKVRLRLNEYVEELHATRPPLGMSVFQVQGELARHSSFAGTLRCPIPEILRRDDAYLRYVEDALNRLPLCRPVIEARNRHPWQGCRPTVYSTTIRDDVRHHFGKLADDLTRLKDSISELQKLGFLRAEPTRALWHTAVETGRLVLDCPRIPAEWFKEEPREIAQAVRQLDECSRSCRRARALLPEFAEEALQPLKAGALAALAASFPPIELMGHPGETLRSWHQRLQRFLPVLRELHRLSDSVQGAVLAVGSQFGLPLTSQPIRALPRIGRLGKLMARTEIVRPSWWEETRRKELQATLSRCREEHDSARRDRAELATRLSPQAFAPESRATAGRAKRFRTWTARWFRFLQWRSLKNRIGDWYVEGLPNLRDLLTDMETLAAYHRRIESGRQVSDQYGSELLVDENGKADWSKTLQALETVEAMERLMPIPAKLKSALAVENGLDRETLATASGTLMKQADTLIRLLRDKAQEIGYVEANDGKAARFQTTAQELAAWLRKRIEVVSGQDAILSQLVDLLAEGRDVPLDVVQEKVQALADMDTARQQVAELCTRLWPGRETTAPEEQDWSVLSAKAAALLRLLDRFPGQPPPAVVRVLTDQQVRSRLAEAVRTSDAVRAAGFDGSWAFLKSLFDLDRPVSTGLVIEAAPLTELEIWLHQRVNDADRLQEWTLFCEVERELAAAEVRPILTEVMEGRTDIEKAGEAFRARFLALWLDAVHERVPALRQFAWDSHERLIERFRDLDRRAVASAAGRIRAFQLSRSDRPRPEVLAPSTSELGTLLREINRKRRHLPLRKLFAKLPTVLPRLKPCLMMSPLAVSTFLDHPELTFDLVIFDEASQVRPHEAISSIYRGKQLIVAGDQKQLPPTDFFSRTMEDDGLTGEESLDEVGLADFESILDVCHTLRLVPRRLKWHYRSRREGLIAFANRFVYQNELVTFPSILDLAGASPISFEYVGSGRWKAGAGGGFNAMEASRTAELVLAHFREASDRSLGVIAFSQRQQMRILDELERLRRANPDLEGFFAEERDEPFFVKNLENVQGDERDVIILGVGYGPDEDTGKVAMRFGPLNRGGGERRLNVAVTRARHAMVVVGSMRAHDLDLTRTKATGVRLLRAFLDYAERGIDALPETIISAEPGKTESPFEREVYEELSRRELTLHTQIGCGGYRIDMAVVDDQTPGRYILGIECDGATYHSSATARDRDRLRQEVLEGLGWRICRIWSTDWIRNPGGQINRVLAVLEQGKKGTVTAPPQRSDPPPPRNSTHLPSQAAPSIDPEEYDSIDDVEDSTLRETLTLILREAGATEDRDLVQSVARRLGFKRTGSRIQERIDDCIEDLIRLGVIRKSADQRLLLTSAGGISGTPGSS